MNAVHDPISDIEAITMSGRGYVDAIRNSFPSVIENSTMDLPLTFVLAIVGFLNRVAVQRVLVHDFPDSIMLYAFLVVLELIYTKVHSFILGILEVVIYID
jgi:hypothetical protein